MGIQRDARITWCIIVPSKYWFHRSKRCSWKGIIRAVVGFPESNCNGVLNHIMHIPCIEQVFKGKKMPGRMGAKQRTVKNVWVYKIDPARNLMWVKGQVSSYL